MDEQSRFPRSIMKPGEIFLDGRRLETAWWGPDAAALVLLHEGLGCVSLWRDVPQRLAAETGCRVFAYSRFGYGRSDPVVLPRPMTYMHDEALNVLPHVLNAAGIQRAVLLGHSDGGSIAAIHAGAVRDPRITGIVPIAYCSSSSSSTSEASCEILHRLRNERVSLPFPRAIMPTSTMHSADGMTPGSIRAFATLTSPLICPISRFRSLHCRARMTLMEPMHNSRSSSARSDRHSRHG